MEDTVSLPDMNTRSTSTAIAWAVSHRAHAVKNQGAYVHANLAAAVKC